MNDPIILDETHQFDPEHLRNFGSRIPDVHAVPQAAAGDTEHDLDRDCWCKPAVIPDKDAYVIRHFAPIAPVQWTSYAGDCRGSIGAVMGPMLGSDQMLTVVTEEYDDAAGRTRLGLSYGVLVAKVDA